MLNNDITNDMFDNESFYPTPQHNRYTNKNHSFSSGSQSYNSRQQIDNSRQLFDNSRQQVNNSRQQNENSRHQIDNSRHQNIRQQVNNNRQQISNPRQQLNNSSQRSSISNIKSKQLSLLPAPSNDRNKTFSNQSFRSTTNNNSRNQYVKAEQNNHGGDPDRIFIKELYAGVVQKKMIGVVIGKFEMRGFPDRKNIGQMKYQMSFTLRDTAVDYINCTCWGQQEFISNLSQAFHIGDIIEVKNVMAQLKQNNEYEEKYKPFTPSQFQLVLNEQHATLSPYFSGDYNEFSSIAYLPIKDNNDYYTLADILAQKTSLNGSLVNILAVVKHSGETKDITTKAGKQMKRREVKLFDDTCNHFPLIIWDGEIADLAETWKAKESVVFLFDVKVSFEEFRQTMVASCTSKTIIITNPDTTEAHHLYSYAQTFQDTMTIDDTNTGSIDISTISDVYNINELQEKLSSCNAYTNPSFNGIVYACVSSFDFDFDGYTRCVSTRCSTCKRRVERHTNQCLNTSCAMSGKYLSYENLKQSFEIPLAVSDYTMGMDGFMLSNQVAETTLKCNVSEYLTKSDDERTSLKWNILFERFKIYFNAIAPTDTRRKPLFNILLMENADVAEMTKN